MSPSYHPLLSLSSHFGPRHLLPSSVDVDSSFSSPAINQLLAPPPSHFFSPAFIYLAVLGLSCYTWDLCCCVWALQLQHTDSVTLQEHGILIPWPGIEPVSPVLQGKSLTTGPPGKYPQALLICFSDSFSSWPSGCTFPSGFCSSQPSASWDGVCISMIDPFHPLLMQVFALVTLGNVTFFPHLKDSFTGGGQHHTCTSPTKDAALGGSRSPTLPAGTVSSCLRDLPSSRSRICGTFFDFYSLPG